jgi:hypothetical protein
LLVSTNDVREGTIEGMEEWYKDAARTLLALPMAVGGGGDVDGGREGGC